VLEIYLRKVKLCDDVDLDKLAHELENYTGADIESLVREACMIALRDGRHSLVSSDHLDPF
jgi:proteasome regulatory subunit